LQFWFGVLSSQMETPREELLRQHVAEVKNKSQKYLRELEEERAKNVRLETHNNALMDEIASLKLALNLACSSAAGAQAPPTPVAVSFTTLLQATLTLLHGSVHVVKGYFRRL
jgi:ABC-type transport system involved in cytochrome bd biosynthesis fused ATPase/permease subunit